MAEENKTSSVKLAINEKYMSQLADIKIRVPKDYKEPIKEYAKSRGVSVNQLIINLINEDAAKNNYELEIPSGIKATKR